MFGGLIETGDELAKAPRGYSNDHEHIKLLRYKTLAVEHSLMRKDIQGSNFDEKIVEIYLEMLPFRRYLNKAVTV